MKIDLNTLKENELREFSYADTKEVISELEKIRMHSLDGIDTIEKTETYYSFVTLIKNRVDHHEFEELKGPDKKAEIKKLHISLDLLLSIFKFSLDGNKLRKQMISLESKIQTTQVDYNAKKEELEDKVQTVVNGANAFQQQVNDSEHTILTHVLTLMGVFTAVITIILSVLTTSNSWLNNASGASAVIAFIVPNLVIIIAMVVLLSIVFFYKKNEIVVISESSQDQNELVDKTLKKAKRIRVFTCILAVIFAMVLLIISLSEIKNSEEAHIRYVLSPGMYKCLDLQDENSESIDKIIEFEIDETSYIFPYDSTMFHDGKLYFCKEHQRLE